MRVDLLEETLDRLEREGRQAEVHLHDPDLPEPGGRDDVAGAQAPARRDGAHERELLVLEDNPYGLLRYEGTPQPDAARARRRRVRDVPRHVLEDPLAGHPARLGAGTAAGAREDQPRQAGGGPVLLDAVAADGAARTSSRRTGATTSTPSPRPTALAATRCSTRSPSTSPRRPSGRTPTAGLFIWATLPDFIDTTDLLARALRENVAFVPGAGAYLDGRGHNAMRLNFSAVDEADIREGVRAHRQGDRRADRAVRHAHREVAAQARGRVEPPAESEGRRDRATCPSAAAPTGGRGASEPGRRPQGRQLARAAGFAAVGSAGRGRARAARTRCGAGRRGRGPDRAPARHAPGRRRSWPCMGATARTAPCRSCSRSSASPTRARACSRARARSTRCSRSTCWSRPGCRRPSSSPSTRPPSSASARRRRCRRSRSGSTSRSS